MWSLGLFCSPAGPPRPRRAGRRAKSVRPTARSPSPFTPTPPWATASLWTASRPWRGSRLGLELADNVKLGEKPVVQSEERKSADTHWENQFGKNRDVRDHYNELNLTLKDGDRIFGVVARAYDDGVAFRLVLPKQPGMDSFTITRDATEYTFTEDNPVWAGWNNGEGAARPEGGFIGSQEWRYLPNKLSGLNPNFKHGLPFLAQTPAAYVAITESDLLDWLAMWLVSKAGAKFTLETQLAPPIPARPWVNGAPAANGAAVSTAAAPTGEVQKGLVVAQTPHNSPWRTFIIGRQAADLISSDLVLNLATPNQIADTSWIKAGMSSWGTWWPNVGKNDLPTLKEYIQLASDEGWPFQLSEIGDKSIVPDLVAYGKERGVKIWLWYHFNEFIDSNVYKRDFPMIAKWGVVGLKIDFIDRDDQWAAKWYEDVAKTAAENHLLINFHGALKPTGLNRTWPNQLTREGIQGNEYNKWSNKETPEHRATLPFTRVLAGGETTRRAGSPTGSRLSSRPPRSPRRCKPRAPASWRCSSSLKARSPSPAILPPTTRIRRANTCWAWTSSRASRPSGTRPTAWLAKWANMWSKRGAMARTGTWRRSVTATAANCRCRSSSWARALGKPPCGKTGLTPPRTRSNL